MLICFDNIIGPLSQKQALSAFAARLLAYCFACNMITYFNFNSCRVFAGTHSLFTLYLIYRSSFPCLLYKRYHPQQCQVSLEKEYRIEYSERKLSLNDIPVDLLHIKELFYSCSITVPLRIGLMYVGSCCVYTLSFRMEQ